MTRSTSARTSSWLDRQALDESRLIVVDDFVDASTCAHILAELDFTWWRQSTVINRDGCGKIVTFRSRTRRSWSADEEYFSRQLITLLADVQDRVCNKFELDRTCLEAWQAIRYDIGGCFDLHHDGGLFAEEPAGERLTTVLLHLATPEDGGATEFPELDISIDARAGRLVIWRNLTVERALDGSMRHRTPSRYCFRGSGAA